MTGFQLTADATKIYRSWFGYKAPGSRDCHLQSASESRNPGPESNEIISDNQPTLDFGDPLFDQMTLKAVSGEQQTEAVKHKSLLQAVVRLPEELVLRMEDGPCPLTHDPARFPVRINREYRQDQDGECSVTRDVPTAAPKKAYSSS